MKILTSKLLAAAITAMVLSSCGFYNEEEQGEYDRVYQATSGVLSRYFNVKESQFIEGHMIAYSKISNQQFGQQRYKVDAWVGRDDEGFFHPHLSVLEEINMAVVDPSKNSRSQQDSVWRSTGFNEKLQTQLLNEIHDAIGYDSPGVSAKWFNTDLQLIERQKKIDSARAGYEQIESGGAPQPHSTPGAK